VISSADILLNAYFGTDVSSELRCQPRVSIGDDLPWDAIVWKDLFKIDFSQFLGSHSFLARNEYDRFGTVVVDNSKNGIISQ
jgi:hypothetical protein